jgi:hypothetical protein
MPISSGNKFIDFIPPTFFQRFSNETGRTNHKFPTNFPRAFGSVLITIKNMLIIDRIDLSSGPEYLALSSQVDNRWILTPRRIVVGLILAALCRQDEPCFRSHSDQQADCKIEWLSTHETTPSIRRGVTIQPCDTS